MIFKKSPLVNARRPSLNPEARGRIAKQGATVRPCAQLFVKAEIVRFSPAFAQFYVSTLRRTDKATQLAWSRLGPGSVFVDLGANVGAVSHAARKMGAEVHSVEPNPWAFSRLRERSWGDSLWHTHQFAVADRDGEARMFLHERHEEDPFGFSSGATLVRSKPNAGSGFVTVVLRDLAQFIRDIGRVDFMKMDVEGLECSLIPHLVQELDWNLVGFVAVETHDTAKWPELKVQAISMRETVASAGLESKVSWNWV